MEFITPTDQGSFDDLVRNVTDGIAETGQKLTECNEAYDAKKGDISLWDKFLDWFKNTMNEVRNVSTTPSRSTTSSSPRSPTI